MSHLLGPIGCMSSGSEMEEKVRKKKARHTWSYSIMNKMLEISSMYQFSKGKSSFPSDYLVICVHAKSNSR